MDENPNAGAGEAGQDQTDGGRFARAKEFVGDKYTAASSAMRDRYNSAREKVEDVDFAEITDQVRNYVRSNPGKALIISLGVGFVVGLLLRRDDD